MNKKLIASRTMQNPLTLGMNTARIGNNGMQFVVEHAMNCGEDVAPNVWRFESLSDAAAKFKDVCALMVSRGYSVVFKSLGADPA